MAVPGICQTNASIKLLGHAYKDSVILRWAPSSPSAWRLLNKHGYRVERYTVTKNNKILDPKPMVILSQLVKPAEQKEWEKWIDQDDYAAVAAQAIFGEGFELSTKGKHDVIEIYHKTQELESRYSFALLSADLSSRAATLSGMRWVDRSVKEDEMYLYRIYSLVPEQSEIIDYGFYYTGPSEYKPLPIPTAPMVYRKDKSVVTVKWDSYALKDTYLAYFLERSFDGGKTFSRVTKSPITLLSPEKKESEFILKIDSVGEAPVSYRLMGISTFGEVGPPSEIVNSTGEAPLRSIPAITKAIVVNNINVELEWSFPEAELSAIKGFQVERSLAADSQYKIIQDNKMSRKFVDSKPLSTNYYRVVAYTAQGQKAISFARLVQLEDSIPPLPPTHVTAVIDTMGVVKLNWNKNSEPDLFGYRVFKSSFKNSEFGQVTVSPLTENYFTDTVNIKTLTRNVWYKIAAVDSRFNTSGFSDLVQLVLPDIIPPVPPVIKGVKAKENGVELQWIRSSSEDVTEHWLYRKHQFSTTWNAIEKINKEDTNKYYLDKVESLHRYQYAMVAVDKSGLKSVMSKPVWGQALIMNKRNKIDKITGIADRENHHVQLTWSYNEQNIQKFLVYRAIADSDLMLYKAVSVSSKKFIDNGVNMNTVYVYRIKVIFKDGGESPFSDAVSVKY